MTAPSSRGTGGWVQSCLDQSCLDSAHARSTKIAVLTSQITMAIRLGSDTAARNRGLEKMRHLFAINGYPNKMIKEHIWKELKKHEERSRGRGRERRERTDQRQRNKKKHGTYIRLPFVNDKVAAQVKKVAINSGLPVEHRWRIIKTSMGVGRQRQGCNKGRVHRVGWTQNNPVVDAPFNSLHMP